MKKTSTVFSAPGVGRRILFGTGVLIVLACVGVRFVSAARMNTISHDDAISYLAATGHEHDYERDQRKLTGHWIPASRLKSYVSVDDVFNFNEIKNDLVDYDIHPPLYFWLLHAWLVVVGVTTAAGPLLNCLIFLCTVVVVYRFVGWGTRDRLPAMTAAALLAASPFALNITIATRQYELLMFFSAAVFFVGTVFSSKTKVSWRDCVLLFAICLGGMLTYYYFVFPIASIVLLLVYREKRLTKKLAAAGASLVAALMVFILVMPRVYIQVFEQEGRPHEVSSAIAIDRLSRVAHASTYFLGWHPAWPLWLGLIGVVFAALGGYLAYRVSASRRRGTHFEKTVAYLFFFNVGVLFLLYMALVTPQHAMEPRYLAQIVPIAVIGGALLIHRVIAARPEWIALLLAVLSINAVVLFASTARTHTDIDAAMKAKKVVMDSQARGVVFRDLFHVSPDSLIYVDWRRYLTHRERPWNSELARGDVIILDDGYSNALFPRDLFRWKVESRHRFVRVNPDEWKIVSSIGE